MKSVDFLIIGGSAAGTTAAEVIRSLSGDSSITVVTDENHEQYSRVLLPHYIRGKVAREQVFLKKPQWYRDKEIELVKGVGVKGLGSIEHVITLDNGEKIKYGKLLIAIGGKVIELNVPRSDNAGILYMRTIEDADAIIKAAKAAKSGVIIGGGFIGLEFASCFRVNGVENVTVLVREPYYWQGKLDEQSSRVLVSTLEKNGVNVLTGEEISQFRGSTSKTSEISKEVEPLILETKNKEKLEADIVGVGIGIKSDFSWLEGSGVKINRGVVTNEFLETSVPDVYAAGDCAEFHDVIFERQHVMGNWANATSQGNAVGKTMSGQRTVFETASSYSINFFDGSCSFIGVTDDKFASETITRGTIPEGKMTRIFIKEIRGTTRIIGATVINSVADVAPLTSAVKNKSDVSKFKDKLADSNFNLVSIIS